MADPGAPLDITSPMQPGTTNIGAPFDITSSAQQADMQSYVNSLQQVPQSGVPTIQQPQQAATVPMLQQQNVTMPSQVAQSGALTAPPKPTIPYTPTVMSQVPPLSQIPVSQLMQFGQLPVNPQVEQAKARVVQALRGTAMGQPQRPAL